LIVMEINLTQGFTLLERTDQVNSYTDQQ
jgi:hypothetical protein